MGLSSRRRAGLVLRMLVLVTLSPLAALPAAVAAPVAMHAGMASGMGRPAAARVQRVGPRFGGRVGRRFPRYGYGDGYLGAAGAALATAAPADQGYGELPPGAVAPVEPPPIAPLPACPMIIKIGPGLDHPTQTRVIYGAPACN